jgi:hypothetical protein
LIKLKNDINSSLDCENKAEKIALDKKIKFKLEFLKNKSFKCSNGDAKHDFN